jgi:hypothetical protein
VLPEIPRFETFCSLEQLHGLARELEADDRFRVAIAGRSRGDEPIYHVACGSGEVRALVVAGPQAQEPVGGLTVYSLMTLLRTGNPELLNAGVEWHLVPCIDPDAALLNEEWYTRPFSVESFIRGFYMQPRPEQVDFSFPIRHKRLVFDRPSVEARVLETILDDVAPDFYFTLHNYASMGGAWFILSRDIGEPYYGQMHRLLKELEIGYQRTFAYGTRIYAEAMTEIPTVAGVYDYWEELGVPIPEEVLAGKVGAASYEYLATIHPGSFTFVSEPALGRHSGDGSESETSHDLRQLKLRVDADNKFLATVILEEWDKTHDDLDQRSPFYAKLAAELIPRRQTLHEGITEWYVHPIQELLFSAEYARRATEGDVVDTFGMGRTMFLANAHTFVRLLGASPQTPAVRASLARLGPVFDAAIADLWEHLSFGTYEPLACDKLAQLQLGSGLIALNSVLAGRAIEPGVQERRSTSQASESG